MQEDKQTNQIEMSEAHTNTAPAHTAPAPEPQVVHTAPVMPVKKSNKTLWIVLGVLGTLLLCCCACSALLFLSPDFQEGFRNGYDQEIQRQQNDVNDFNY